MIILGIDTSTPIGSVGLIDGETVIAEHTLNIRKHHASRLMPVISQIFEWSNIKIQEIDGVAIAVGPGSFTGLRTGVATAKSIAYALQKPIVGISTLKAIANNLRYINKLICPILSARRDEVYSAIFSGGKNFERRSEDLCTSIENVLELLSGEVIFIADQPKLYIETIRRHIASDQIIFADASFRVPRGVNIAELGRQQLENGNADDYFAIVPNYVRTVNF